MVVGLARSTFVSGHGVAHMQRSHLLHVHQPKLWAAAHHCRNFTDQCGTSSKLLTQASQLHSIHAPSLQPPAAKAAGLLAGSHSIVKGGVWYQVQKGHTDRAVATHVVETTSKSIAPVTANPRVRVAVDVDEVLGRFVYTLNKFCKEKYDMHYDVNDYWIYEFAKIWGCNQDRSNYIVHEFFDSQHFNDGIPIIPGASEVLLRLSQSHDLVVVTSRQHIIQDATLDWIDRHYPGLFQEVYFGNHFALEGTSRKKSDICKAIGASVLIDDNPTYALECAAAGIHVLLYDWELGYPWSKLPQGKSHPLITVVRNWDEVEGAMLALAPRLLNNH